jgi:protein-tyrosine phosphatase
MAEFIMKDLVSKKGESSNFYIESAATSAEELGNPVYPPAKRTLNSIGINCDGKFARRITKGDYEKFDYIIGMDEMNRRALKSFFNDVDNKISILLDFTDRKGEVADPWWTRDFNATLFDVTEGTNALYEHIKNK